MVSLVLRCGIVFAIFAAGGALAQTPDAQPATGAAPAQAPAQASSDEQLEQEDRIAVRPRAREASRLFLTEAQVTALKIVTIDLVPVALLGLGLAVWLVRRSR